MIFGYIMVLILLCLSILVYILIIFYFFFTFQNETIKKVYVEYVGYDLTYAFKKGGTFPAIYDGYVRLVKHIHQQTSLIFFYLYGSIESVSKLRIIY